MLKQDFNKYLNDVTMKNPKFNKKAKTIQDLGEEASFDALCSVLNNTPYAVSEPMHGRKGWVKHDLAYKHNQPDERRCEISDLLLLFFCGDQLRYTFLQNKRIKSPKILSSSPLLKCYADMVQWDLLHYRCKLTDVGITELPMDCLSSAKLDGAASYGIFINDNYVNTVDMVYYIAKDLYPVNSALPINHGSSVRQFYTDPTNLHIYISSNGLEVSGIRTLDEFELFSRLFLVGSPVDLVNQNDLAGVLLSSAKKVIKESIDNPNIHYQHELTGEQIEKRQNFLRIINNFSERHELILNEEFNGNISKNIVIVNTASNIIYLSNEEEITGKIFKEFAKYITVISDINNPLIDTADLIIADKNFYRQSEPTIKNKLLDKKICIISFENFISLL